MEIVWYYFKIVCFLVLLFGKTHSISDLRFCGNADCTEILSLGKTTLTYQSIKHNVLSFKNNEIVTIYSKSAGKNPDLWGVEINGKRGYAPYRFITEGKVLHRPKVKVPTELYEIINGKIVLKKINERKVKVKDGAYMEDKQNEANSEGEKITEMLSSTGKSVKSSIINGALEESSDSDKKKIKISQTHTIIERTSFYSGTEPEPPAVSENTEHELLNTDSEVNDEDSVDEQDGEGSGSGEEEYSGDEPVDGEDDLVNVGSNLGVGADTGVQKTVHSIMPVSANVPVTDEPKNDAIDVNSDPANLKIDASVNDTVVSSDLDNLQIDSPVNTKNVGSDLDSLQFDAPVNTTNVSSDLDSLQFDAPVNTTNVSSDLDSLQFDAPVNTTNVSSDLDSLQFDAPVNTTNVSSDLDSLQFDAPVNTTNVSSDLDSLQFDAPVNTTNVSSDPDSPQIDSPVNYEIAVKSDLGDLPIDETVNDAINSTSENLPNDKPADDVVGVTGDLDSLPTKTIQSFANMKENIIGPDIPSENTKDPIVPEVDLFQSNPVQNTIFDDEPQLPALEQNNIDQPVYSDTTKISPPNTDRNIDLPVNVSLTNNSNSENSKIIEIAQQLSLQNNGLPIKNNSSKLPEELLISNNNQTFDNIENTSKDNLQTPEEIVGTVPYSGGIPTNNQDTKNTNTPNPVKNDINIESIYFKPQSSSSSHSLDSNSQIREHLVEPYYHNDTELEMDNLNNTNILEVDGNNQDQQQPELYRPTQIPPVRVTTDSDSEQYEAPILPGYYSSEASTQSLPPVEPVTQYPVIPPADLPGDANREFSQDKTSELPPQPNPVVENLSYFNEYFSNVDNVKRNSEELVDSPQDPKENNSELKDDLLTQSESKIMDEVNNKNVLINDDSVESLSLDAPAVSESYVSNLIDIFEGLSGKIFSLFQSTSSHSDDLARRLEEDGKPRLSNEASALSSDSVASIFTDPSPPQCLAEERMESWRDVSADKIFWLIISAVSILVFTLGYYYLENRKQDGKLLSMVNSLQKELLCTSKECIILKDDLTITKEKLIGIEDSSFGSDEMVACLKKEIAEGQQTISDLYDKLASAEEELANSTEAALELQAILDDQLSSKDTSSSSLAFTVANLQSQLDDQQTTMNQTKAQLAAKVEENELLILKILDTSNKSVSMEKELIDCQKQLVQARDECESKSSQLQDLTSNMEKSLQQLKEQKVKEVKELKLQIKNLKEDIETTKVALKARAHEVTSLQENLKLLKLDSKNIEAILDTSHTKAALTQALSEKAILAEKLEKEQSLLLELSNKVDEQDARMAQMKEQLNEAEQKSIQATSRLEVLTNYFNQKEADLLKELSSKENLWLSQQGEAMSTVEKIQSLQQEIQQYKETAEGVRRELAEQEVAWRARGAALERRAHEQWLARRAAERQAEASATEAQALRHRLAGPSPTDKRVVSPLNMVDGVPDLGLMGLPPPLPFLPPPLPLPFLPPPPLPPHRPPPLGRLSSPPPLPPQHMRHDRYSPDSRYSPERDYSPDRRSTPQQRVRSPFSPQEARRRGYPIRRYEDDRYYDSGEERRSRRYDETETDLSPPPSPPPPRRLGPRNHKGVSSGSGQSSESLERISKHSGKY